jgi:hypothetical protein
MRVEGTIRSLRVMLRANTIIAGIHGRQFAARSGLAAFAALVGGFGLLMLGLALFFALELVWGRVWAAVAVGVFNIALAVAIGAVAARLRPGRELAIATEVRDAAVENVTGDLRAVEEDMAALAHAVRHPLDSTIAGLATPLVAMLLKAVKGGDDEADAAEPAPPAKPKRASKAKSDDG